MGFQIESNPDLGKNVEIVSTSEISVNQTWNPVYGERDEIRNNYNQVSIRLKEKTEPGREFEITFRAYNEGVAFNYTFLPSNKNDSITIQKENTEFNFNENYNCWASERAQSEIQKIQINAIKNPVERPLVIETGNQVLALG